MTFPRSLILHRFEQPSHPSCLFQHHICIWEGGPRSSPQ